MRISFRTQDKPSIEARVATLIANSQRIIVGNPREDFGAYAG